MLNIDFYWHSCRHNFCTSLLEQGLPEAVVTQVIGWANSTMVEIYDDRDKDDMLGEYFNEDGIVVTISPVVPVAPSAFEKPDAAKQPEIVRATAIHKINVT